MGSIRPISIMPGMAGSKETREVEAVASEATNVPRPTVPEIRPRFSASL